MMSIRKAYIISWLWAVLFIVSAAGTFGSGTGNFLISLDVKDEKITQVLEKISKASGYHIIFSGKGEDMPVSLQLKDTGLEEMLRRVLRNLNYTAVWDNAGKKILLSVYGVKGNFGGLPEISSQPQEQLHEFWKNTIGDRPEQSENGPEEHEITIYRPEEPYVSISGTDTPFIQATDTVNGD